MDGAVQVRPVVEPSGKREENTMKGFVAGASGAIGTRLVPQLIERGHEVIGTSKSRGKAERIAALGARAIVLDLLDAPAVGKVVLDSEPDAVVNQATASRLKYGLRFVSHQLWDDVLGWAVTRGHWDDADLQKIDAYLLGGTVFRYATIFGGSFSRSAFVEALAAGVRDEPFPLRAILLATRDKYPTLSFGRRRVSALRGDTEESRWDRRWLGDNNVALLLSIAQNIDVDHERPLDIDHIYASALASRMHAADNWRTHHPERWRVNTIGNMWLLDAGTNRALQDLKPPMKFESLKHWLEATPATRRVWPTAQWSMTDSEIRSLIEVDTELDHDIDGPMKKFAELVQARADRLLDTPFEVLPDATLFAVDTELEPPDDWRPADGALPPELSERLGLNEVLERLEKASPRTRPEGDPGVPGERRPILEVPRRWGWPKGWRTEFAYVDFHGERWEERNIKTLYNRTFKWLWTNRREDLLQWNKKKEQEGPIAGPRRIGRWDRLDDEHYLQMGMFYRYLVEAVQEVLEALGLADGVYVVYANPDE
jgi:NAD dependent epimerase/dehydratase family/Protein of unknown function (DUF1524)